MKRDIAACSFDCVPPKGRRFRLHVHIGEPVTIPSSGGLHEYGSCPIELRPLIPEFKIAGVDRFQALCLAINFLRLVLRAFLRDGGRIYYPDTKSPIDVESESFTSVLSLTELQRHVGRHFASGTAKTKENDKKSKTVRGENRKQGSASHRRWPNS